MIQRLLTLSVGLATTVTLCGAAHAESEPCEAPSVAQILPTPGAIDVPTNARILVDLAGGEGCELPALEFRLTHSKGIVTLEERPFELLGTIAFQPTRPLAAETEYTFEVLGLDGVPGHGELYRFTTGSDALHPTTQTPRIRIVSARYDALACSTADHELTVEVAPTHDSAPVDMLRVAVDAGAAPTDSEDDYPLAIRPDPDGWSTSHTFISQALVADEVCVVVRQQDIAGQWSAPSRACAESEAVEGLFESTDEHGCTASPGKGGPAWFVLLALPALALTRRRRRGPRR